MERRENHVQAVATRWIRRRPCRIHRPLALAQRAREEFRLTCLASDRSLMSKEAHAALWTPSTWTPSPSDSCELRDFAQPMRVKCSGLAGGHSQTRRTRVRDAIGIASTPTLSLLHMRVSFKTVSWVAIPLPSPPHVQTGQSTSPTATSRDTRVRRARSRCRRPR